MKNNDIARKIENLTNFGLISTMQEDKAKFDAERYGSYKWKFERWIRS